MQWVSGQLASHTVPDLRLLDPPAAVTLRDAAERWRKSRVDVSAGTMQTYRVAIAGSDRGWATRRSNAIDAQTVADLVAELHADGLKKQTISKTVSVLAMVLDHAGIPEIPPATR